MNLHIQIQYYPNWCISLSPYQLNMERRRVNVIKSEEFFHFFHASRDEFNSVGKKIHTCRTVILVLAATNVTSYLRSKVPEFVSGIPGYR